MNNIIPHLGLWAVFITSIWGVNELLSKLFRAGKGMKRFMRVVTITFIVLFSGFYFCANK